MYAPSLVALTSAFLFYLYNRGDFAVPVQNHRPGVCRLVEGIDIGSEDIELIRSEGIAFVTSGVVPTSPPKETGAIFIYDFNQNPSEKTLKATKIKINGLPFPEIDFHPHGLTHWVINGVIRLYVINHSSKSENSIEVFDFNPSGPHLDHRKSIKHSTLIKPNGIVAVGPDRFVFTNDGYYHNFVGTVLEFVFRLNTGSVFSYDGKEFHELLGATPSSNGIAFDDSAHKLFVSMLSVKQVDAFDLAKDLKSVKAVSSVKTQSACDNLFLDTDGSIYSGCHPVSIKVAQHISDCYNPSVFSPSQVLRLHYDSKFREAQVTEVFSDTGAGITGSSVAVMYNNQMLIGTICKTLMHCEIIDRSVLHIKN